MDVKLKPKFEVGQVVFAESIGYVKILKRYPSDHKFRYIVTNGLSAELVAYVTYEVPEYKLYSEVVCESCCVRNREMEERVIRLVEENEKLKAKHK